MGKVAVVFVFLSLLSLQTPYPETLAEGLSGVWVNQDATPKDVWVISKLQNAYRLTLLPGNQYQKQKSFIVNEENGNYYFGDNDVSYSLHPYLDRGFLELTYTLANVPDDFTSVLTPIKDRHLVNGYLILNDTGVRLRKGASIKSDIVRKMDKGEVVKVLEVSNEEMPIQGKSGHWTKVREVSGAVGWIFSAFLDELN